MTYGELIESINCIASALQKKGFRSNDTVLLMAKNHIEMVITYLAVWSIEGCSASLGISYCCLPGVEVIVIGGRVANCIFFDDLLLEGRTHQEKKEIEANKCKKDGLFNLESPMCLIFSSGTTGVPKCIVHTHRSFNNFTIYQRYDIIID